MGASGRRPQTLPLRLSPAHHVWRGHELPVRSYLAGEVQRARHLVRVGVTGRVRVRVRFRVRVRVRVHGEQGDDVPAVAVGVALDA